MPLDVKKKVTMVQGQQDGPLSQVHTYSNNVAKHNRCFCSLKGHLGFPWEDCQHSMIDEFQCMVAGCVLRGQI